MKISILVPAYNVEEYIDECLTSVINQTYKNDFEIIVVDNASKDLTGKILDDYASQYKNIKVYHLEKNIGLFMSRHFALKKANGDYCIFLDSDDTLRKEALEIIADDIRKVNSPDLLLYRYKCFGDSSQESINVLNINELKLCNEEELHRIRYCFCTTSQINNIWIKAVKRDYFLKVNDYKNYSRILYGEDKLNSIYLYQSNFIAYEPAILYEYRVRNNSISTNFTIERYLQSSIITRKLIDELVTKENFSKHEIKSILKYQKRSEMHLLLKSLKIDDLGDKTYMDQIFRDINVKNNIYKKVKAGIFFDLMFLFYKHKKFKFILLIKKIVYRNKDAN